MKVIEWHKIWLETYKVPFLTRNGMECLRYCMNHILREFGGKEIDQIRGFEIQQFLNGLSDTPNMQHKVKVYFNDLLEYAYRNRIIDFNPMLALKYRVPKQVHRRAMTVDEQRAFVESLGGKHYRLLFLIYLYTGARRAEILDEKLEVDFENGVVKLHGTKTQLSDRTLPLFARLRKELDGVDYSEYLSHYSLNNVSRIMRLHCKRNGFENFCVHSLRATFATRCLEAGLQPKTIQLWLGHSRLDMTMNTYVDGRALVRQENGFMQSEAVKFSEKWD